MREYRIVRDKPNGTPWPDLQILANLGNVTRAAAENHLQTKRLRHPDARLEMRTVTNFRTIPDEVTP